MIILKRSIAKSVSLMLILVCLVLPFAEALAAPVLTSETLRAQIDAYIKKHEDTTAGLSIEVVRAQQTLYRKDYGYSDIAEKRAVDKDTVFEWGSVTKLLVWTSVMQQVEQNKMDLNAPVTEYLPSGFLKRLKYDEPITMMNLMHHNAGWEEFISGIFERPDFAIDSLGEALQRLEPRQLRKPGEAVGYSNYGVALAGYIVECVSGMPFYEYVNQNIFAPLNMQHTSMQPTLEDNPWVQEHRPMSKGYTTECVPIENLFMIPLYPAGMATGTMDDFALFCKALLPAEGENTPLFASRETLEMMLSPSLCYGDSEMARNHHGFWTIPFETPMIGHGGNTAAFSAYLLIHPESQIGFVVMTNQSGEMSYTDELPHLLFGKAEYESVGETIDARELRGVYQSSRVVQNGCAKLYSLLMTMPLPSATEDSLFATLSGKNIVKLNETAPGIFASEEGSAIPLGDFLYAAKTPSGRNTFQMPYMEFVQTSSYQIWIEYALILLFVLAILVCMGMMTGAFVSWIIRKIRKKSMRHDSAYKMHVGLCSLALGVLVNTVVFLSGLFMTFASHAILSLHMGINIAYIVLSMGGIVFLFLKWRKSALSRWRRIQYGTTIVSTLIITMNLLYWNLCWF